MERKKKSWELKKELEITTEPIKLILGSLGRLSWVIIFQDQEWSGPVSSANLHSTIWMLCLLVGVLGCPSPSPLWGISTCPSNPAHTLRRLPGHLQAELSPLHSAGFVTAHSAIIISLLGLSCPPTNPLLMVISSRTVCSLLVSCPAQSPVPSLKGEHSTPGAGKSTPLAGCSLPVMWIPLTPPRKANCLFLLCQLVKRRGKSSFPSFL